MSELNNWAWSQTLVNFISLCWLENVCITRKIARLKAVKHVWEHGSLIDGSQNGCFLPPAPVVTVELLFKIWQKWTIPATLFWHKQVECLEKHYFKALCKPTEVVLYPHITLCHSICDPVFSETLYLSPGRTLHFSAAVHTVFTVYCEHFQLIGMVWDDAPLSAKSETLTVMWHFCQLGPKGAPRGYFYSKWVIHARFGMSCIYDSKLPQARVKTQIAYHIVDACMDAKLQPVQSEGRGNLCFAFGTLNLLILRSQWNVTLLLFSCLRHRLS